MAIISEAPLNPKYVYVQATEPTDKTEGKIWYNTIANTLYSSDGTSYQVLETDVSSLETRDLEQDLNILINSASASSTLNSYEDMFVDIFSDVNGTSNTIDIGNTTAIFDTDKYINQSWTFLDTFTRGDNASVGDAEIGGGTWAETEEGGTVYISGNALVLNDNNSGANVTCINTFSTPDIAPSRIDIKLKLDNVTTSYGVVHFRNGGTEAFALEFGLGIGIKISYGSTIDTMSDDTYRNISIRNINWTAHTFDVYSDDVSKLTAEPFANNEAGIDDVYIHTGGTQQGIITIDEIIIEPTYANTLVQTNAITITANPIGHQVYCHNTIAGSGSVDYDISFDNGSTWITGQALNTSNTSVHAGSQMKLKLNLKGVGAGNTAEAKDYAVMLDY